MKQDKPNATLVFTSIDNPCRALPTTKPSWSNKRRRNQYLNVRVEVLLYAKPYFKLDHFFVDWKTCSFDETCARQCITNFMMRYAPICARELSKSPQDLTCLNFGRIHNGGPHGCKKTSTLAYDDVMRRKCGLQN